MDPVFYSLLYNTGTVKEADICWIYIAVSNVMKKYNIQVIIQVFLSKEIASVSTSIGKLELSGSL